MCDLHRALKISNNFEAEVKIIKKKFLSAGYPVRFVESVITQFKDDNIERLIPKQLFEEEDERPLCRIKVPYCRKNEHLAKKFQSKLELLCPEVKFMVIWKTTKIRTCFPLKDKITHRCSVVYHGLCTCGEDYVGETKRCEHVRFGEHDDPTGTSEPSKHLQTENGKTDIIHKFTWTTLTRASPFASKRKILEGLYIAKCKPSLNEQVNCYKLILFRSGIT